MALFTTVSSFWHRVSPWRPMITVILTGGVLSLAWIATRHLVDDISYDEMISALEATPSWAVIVALLLTAASFATLVVYDFGGLDYTGRKLPAPLVILTSFCSYAVGNTAGFGPLTAGAIRYRFYTPHGIDPDDIARIVAFVTAAFGLGLCGVVGLSFLVVGPQALTPFSLSPTALQGIGVLLVIGLIGLWGLAGRDRPLALWGLSLRLPSRPLMTRQFLATVADMILSAAVLWILLPPGSVSLPSFVAIYSVAIGLGVISHIPAGLGVFETVIIASLGGQIDVDNLLGALVLYRAIYHLVPLALAALIITVLELRRAAELPLVGAAFRVGTRLAPPVLGAVTLVLGVLAVFSSITPLSPASVDILSEQLPLGVVEAAYVISGVMGVMLVVVARGLVYRLTGAWWAAMVMVPLCLILSAGKSGAQDETILALVLTIALIASRHEFHRPASLFQQAFTTGWLVALTTLLITAATLLFFIYKDVDYANRLWLEFDFTGDAPRGLRSLLAIGVTAMVGIFWFLVRPAAPPKTLPTPEELSEARAIAAAQDRTEATLVAMGDKYLLFSEDRRAFIMYGRHGRSWVALFDPIGPRECWPDLIWGFVEMARRAGGRPAFYQVGADSLSFYVDAGMKAFKLGEEAHVRLADFNINGQKNTGLRYKLNRAKRDGLDLEIIPTEDVPVALDELAAVSAVWMKTHNVREKRFSLGAFDRAYLATQPVAVLRQEGRIVAFATLMLTDQTSEARIDLIRYLPDAPKGVMDILLTQVMFHFRDAGYTWFILGMAPLSGLSNSEAAPIWHHVGREVFEHGEWFYNFSGLRAFKAKFLPEWQPRYLAVSGNSNPMIALADITVLISGGLKGVIGK